MAQLIVNAGGVAAVVDYIGESKGNIRLPGVMMLGYVAAQSENLAMATITSKVSKLHNSTLYNDIFQQGVAQLAVTLSEEQEDHILVSFCKSIYI